MSHYFYQVISHSLYSYQTAYSLDGERFNRLSLGGEERMIPWPMFKECWVIPVLLFIGGGGEGGGGRSLWTGVVGIDTPGSLF